MTRCSRDRIVVDTYVKVNVSDWTDLLVYSPAVEEQYNCIKTKVEKVNDGDDCPPVYVVMDDKKTIKKVQGLQLPPDFFPDDYFESVEDAQKTYVQAVLAQPVVAAPAPAIAAESVATAVPSTQVINLFLLFTILK